MKILHFCSYYTGSKVYKELFNSLVNKKITPQLVFVPLRSANVCSENTLKNTNIEYNYVKCLSFFTRAFYCLKLLVIFLFSLQYRKKSKQLSFIHAHTLYADGVPAYCYAKRHSIALVITIRTTDVALGFKYYFHYKWFAKKALAYANKIVFVSPAHKVKFQHYFGHCYDNKLIVVPNGIDKFYLENKLTSAVYENKNRVALYVGTINKNKNLKASITAFFNISINSDDEFRVVGGTYKEYVDIYGELPVNLIHRVNFLGKLSKEQVLGQMRSSTLFIMVSHSETFGLVYIEAISQCLPIVYTLGQGVDGYFNDGEFGYRANSNDIESISQAISKTTTDFPHGLGPFVENPANNFSWESIATIYKEQVYK